MMRRNKKGFTIVELVIVIAVIAILAAVLIPTFSNLIKKANISADTQLCKNMNTALEIAEAEGKEIKNMSDVLTIVNEAGYIIDHLNPTTEGYYFAWDEGTNQILFLDGENNFNVQFSTGDPSEKALWWVTVGGAEEAVKVANGGMSIYFEKDIDTVTLDKMVNINTGYFKCDTLAITDNASTGSYTLSGNIETLNIEAENADVKQYGRITTANILKIKSESFEVYGFIQNLNISAGRARVTSGGYAGTVTAAAGSPAIVVEGQAHTVTAATGATMTVSVNGGMVNTVEKVTATVDGGYVVYNNSQTESTKPEGFALNVEINDLAELENFRDQVNAGRTFESVIVSLKADIDLSARNWTPIGITSRKPGNSVENVNGVNYVGQNTWFSGTFDGGNHQIIGLSNTGYAPVDEMLYFAERHGLKTYAYGFFGAVIDAEILNLKMTNVSINAVSGTAADGTEVKGDSIGAIVGFSGGSLTMKNCEVSGHVYGFDAIGGLVGRIYNQDKDSTRFGGTESEDVIIENCINNAAVSGDIKCAGILGFIGDEIDNFTMKGCVNNGAVTATDKRESYANGLVGFAVITTNMTITNNRNTGKLTTLCTRAIIAYIAGQCAWETNVKTSSFTGNTNTGEISTPNVTATPTYVYLIRLKQEPITTEIPDHENLGK